MSHVATRSLSGGLAFAALKLWRPDVNERVFYLPRRELTRIYGRAAVHNALKQARSIGRLDPAARELLAHSRRRRVLEHRRTALLRKIKSLEIKANQTVPRGLEPAVQQAQQGVSALDRELEAIDRNIAELGAQISARRDEIRAGGTGLANEREDLAHGQITFVEYRRKLSIRQDKAFVGTLERAMTTALTGARGKVFRESFAPVLRDSIESLLLAAPDEASLPEFLAERVGVAARLFAEFANSPLLRALDPRSATQLFEELIKSVSYPCYRGELVIGYGGTEDPPNVRLATYLLPGLVLMRAFVRAGIEPPKLRIPNAYALAVAFNSVAGELARKNAHATQNLLAAFVARFFPELVPHVYTTTPSYEEFVDTPVFRLALEILQAFAVKHPNNRPLESLIAKAWRHHSDLRTKTFEMLTPDELSRVRGQALSYVACHIVEPCFGDVYAHQPDRWEPEWVGKIGGSGENDFNFFEDVLSNHECFRPSLETGFFRPNTSGIPKDTFHVSPIQLRSALGETPPYYAVNDEEVRVDALEGVRFDDLLYYYRSNLKLRHVAGDLEALEKVGIDGEEYLAFLRGLRTT